MDGILGPAPGTGDIHRCPRDWILAVTRAGLYLNLAQGRAATGGQEATAIAHICFGEVHSACASIESSVPKGFWKRRRRRMLELTLRSRDTTALEQALRNASLHLRASPSPLFGQAESHVRVARPGVIQVAWQSGMLYALAGRVRLVGPEHLDRTGRGSSPTRKTGIASPPETLDRGRPLRLLRDEPEQSPRGTCAQRDWGPSVEERRRRA